MTTGFTGEIPEITHRICGAIGTPERAALHVAAQQGEHYGTIDLHDLLLKVQGENPVVYGRTYARGTIGKTPLDVGTFEAGGSPKKYSLTSDPELARAQPTAATLLVMSYAFSTPTQTIVGEKPNAGKDRLSPAEVNWRVWHKLQGTDQGEIFSARDVAREAGISESAANLAVNRMLGNALISYADDDLRRFYFGTFNPPIKTIDTRSVPQHLREVSVFANCVKEPFTPKDVLEKLGYISSSKAKRVCDQLEELRDLGLIQPLIDSGYEADGLQLTKRGANLGAAIARLYSIADGTDEEALAEATKLVEVVRNDPTIVARAISLSPSVRTAEAAKEARQNIGALLKETEDGVNATEIAHTLNLSLKSTYRLLQELKDEGIGTYKKAGRVKLWTST